MEVKRFSDKQEFLQVSADAITSICKEKAGECYIGLSGGKTPKPVYLLLSEHQDFDAGRVQFFVVDERYVPLDHPDANYHMIAKSLIEPIGVDDRFHHFDTSQEIEVALEQYEQELLQIPDQSLDLVVLGIGTDGHTASLFPHSEALSEQSRLVAHTQTQSQTVADRLTMTLPMILHAKKLLVLLSGNEKAQILEKLMQEDVSVEEYPAKALFTHSDITIHLYE